MGGPVKDGMGVMDGMQLTEEMRVGVGVSGTIWQAKHTLPRVMCFPHLLTFERPLIIWGIVSVHSLRILLFLK
jgi:hypothetical protein